MSEASRAPLPSGGTTSALSILSRSAAKQKQPVRISGKAAPRSLRGGCNGAVGQGRMASNGTSTRSWRSGFTSCHGGGRTGWNARVQSQGWRTHVQAPHVPKRRAICRLSRRTIFPFEEGDEDSRCPLLLCGLAPGPPSVPFRCPDALRAGPGSVSSWFGGGVELPASSWYTTISTASAAYARVVGRMAPHALDTCTNVHRDSGVSLMHRCPHCGSSLGVDTS
jgi:hypothetical protein